MLLTKFKTVGRHARVLSRDVSNELRRELPDHVMNTVVREDDRHGEAPAWRKPMAQFDPEHKDLAKVRELPVILVCRSGQTSANAAAKLASAGFTKVHWLDGGLASWTGADLPLAKGKA